MEESCNESTDDKHDKRLRTEKWTLYNLRQHRQLEITEYMTDVMFKLKELMKSVYNQTPAKHSSTSHVCHVLVGLTNSLLTSLIYIYIYIYIFFFVINSLSKTKWLNRPRKEETSAVED